MYKTLTLAILMISFQFGLSATNELNPLEEIEARDDYNSGDPGESITINILSNDKGEGVYVSQIITQPSCGEITSWEANGVIVYVPYEDTECSFDVFEYEITDNSGEKATAIVTIGINQVPDESEEEELEGIDDFEFTDPGLPVTINVLQNDSGEGLFVSQIVNLPSCGDIINWETNGNITYIPNDTTSCHYDTFGYELTSNLGIKDTASVTIGIVNVSSVEEESQITTNPSLQLYPNPNQGQFSLQIQSPSTSLQYHPIQVYHIGGQLIWQGNIQSNRLETLEVENVESGLYILPVVLEEKVLVERFWVE